MEYAMMDEVVSRAKAMNLKKIVGHYYPTPKNGMVKEFYGMMGFTKISEDAEGNTCWEYDISGEYINKNSHIKVK